MRGAVLENFEIKISDSVREKLKIHRVSEIEIEEALYLHQGPYLVDDRIEHRTKPPTVWFIGHTWHERLLKVVMKIDKEKKVVAIKTAYDPSEEEIQRYEEST